MDDRFFIFPRIRIQTTIIRDPCNIVITIFHVFLRGISRIKYIFLFLVYDSHHPDIHRDVNSEHDDGASLDARLIAGGATVAVVTLLVVIIIMAVMFLRSRQSDECNKLKQQPGDCDALEYRNGEGKHFRFDFHLLKNHMFSFII